MDKCLDNYNFEIIKCDCVKGISYTEEFTDMVLEVDGNEIAVHRQFLAVRCEYFKTMFYGEFAESKENRIQINNVKWSPFKAIIDYLYTGVLIGTAREAPEIYSVAHRMRLADATETISMFMSYRIWDRNFTEYINCAYQFDIPNLKEVCCEVWCRRVKAQNYDTSRLSEEAKMGLNNYEMNFNGAEEPQNDPPINDNTCCCDKDASYTTEFTDMVLVVDGKEIAVHRQVLALRSEYFKIMFYGEFAESKKTRIHLNDIKWTLFKKLVDYMYSGKLEITQEEALDICMVTHMLCLFDATEKISTFLADKVVKENFVEYANFAYEFDLPYLSSGCFSYAVDRKDIEEEIQKLSEIAILGFMKEPQIANTEIKKFRMVCSWLKVNDKSKAEKLMSKIDLSLMTMDEIRDTVWPSGYFTDKQLLQTVFDIIKDRYEIDDNIADDDDYEEDSDYDIDFDFDSNGASDADSDMF